LNHHLPVNPNQSLFNKPPSPSSTPSVQQPSNELPLLLNLLEITSKGLQQMDYREINPELLIPLLPPTNIDFTQTNLWPYQVPMYMSQTQLPNSSLPPSPPDPTSFILNDNSIHPHTNFGLQGMQPYRLDDRIVIERSSQIFPVTQTSHSSLQSFMDPNSLFFTNFSPI